MTRELQMLLKEIKELLFPIDKILNQIIAGKIVVDRGEVFHNPSDKPNYKAVFLRSGTASAFDEVVKYIPNNQEQDIEYHLTSKLGFFVKIKVNKNGNITFYDEYKEKDVQTKKTIGFSESQVSLYYDKTDYTSYPDSVNNVMAMYVDGQHMIYKNNSNIMFVPLGIYSKLTPYEVSRKKEVLGTDINLLKELSELSESDFDDILSSYEGAGNYVFSLINDSKGLRKALSYIGDMSSELTRTLLNTIKFLNDYTRSLDKEGSLNPLGELDPMIK